MCLCVHRAANSSSWWQAGKGLQGSGVDMAGRMRPLLHWFMELSHVLLR